MAWRAPHPLLLLLLLFPGEGVGEPGNRGDGYGGDYWDSRVR